jgi:hypothetical protein
MPIDIFLGLIFAAALFLAILTVSAIVEAVVDYFPNADTIQIVDPSASRELERIAAQKGSKQHKRFAFDRKTKKTVMVEGNKIAPELRGEEIIDVDIH